MDKAGYDEKTRCDKEGSKENSHNVAEDAKPVVSRLLELQVGPEDGTKKSRKMTDFPHINMPSFREKGGEVILNAENCLLIGITNLLVSSFFILKSCFQRLYF